MNFKTTWHMFRDAYSAWGESANPGAVLAFYTILSLAPLVILAIAIIALIFGHSTAQKELLRQVDSMVGQQGAEVVRGMIAGAQKPVSGVFASVIGAITLLYGASGVFGALRAALNKTLDVKPNGDAGFWSNIRQTFFSIGMVLSVGFLLLVSLVISAGLAALGKFFGGMLPMPELVLNAINLLISMAGTTMLFALIFRYVPDEKIAWKQIWIGAAATAFLFTIGKYLIGLYLGKAAVGSAYGAAGSLVVLIVWVYYSARIFLLGAEFTHVLDSRVDSTRRNQPASFQPLRPGSTHLRLDKPDAE